MASNAVYLDLFVTPSSKRRLSSTISNTVNTAGVGKGTKDLGQFHNALGRITGQASEFQKSLDAATARVFAFGAAMAVINGVRQAFAAMINSTIEVEARMTEIRAIFGQTEEQFLTFKDAIFDAAKATGQTFQVVGEGAAELARLGLNAEESALRLNAALVLTNISAIDSAKAVKSLTAIMNGFAEEALTAKEIVNKLVAVDTAFAISADDLVDGMARAASTAQDAGLSLDEFSGLITAVAQRTGRSGAVIGNAFKSIFPRLTRSRSLDQLKELGVEIDASQTGIQKLKALGTALKDISDPVQANKIKEIAGGLRQINIVSAALKDIASDSSLATQATKLSADAQNEAFEKNAELVNTLRGALNELTISFTQMGAAIGGITLAPIIGQIAKAGSSLATMVKDSLGEENGNIIAKTFVKAIANVLSGPGVALIGFGIFKLFKLVAKFAKQGVKEIFALNSKSAQTKEIQIGIVELLGKDEALRDLIFKSAASVEKKDRAIINAISQQNIELFEQEKILKRITRAAVAAGVGKFQKGYFKNKGKATGHQAEAAAEVLQARSLGATNSVRAVRSKGTIGGKRFTMNTQEIEIPNFGSNGDSAVIPLYAKGLIPNFAKEAGEKPLSSQRLEEILNANASKPFVKRIRDPQKNGSIDLGGGSIGTHLMAAEVDEKGHWITFPTIQLVDGKLQHLELREAQARAKKTGNYIDHGNTEESKNEALWFSKNYKQVWKNSSNKEQKKPSFAQGFIPNFANFVSLKDYLVGRAKGIQSPSQVTGALANNVNPAELKQHVLANKIPVNPTSKAYKTLGISDKEAKTLGIKSSGTKGGRKKTQDGKTLPSIQATKAIGRANMPTVLTPNVVGQQIPATLRIPGGDKNAGALAGRGLAFNFDAFRARSGDGGVQKIFDKAFDADAALDSFFSSTILPVVHGVSSSLGGGKINPKDVRSINRISKLTKQMNTALGHVFEAAIATALDLDAQENKSNAGNFDIRLNSKGLQQRANLKALFGDTAIPKNGLADFKINADNSNLVNMAKKIYREPGFKATLLKAAQADEALYTKGTGKAAGYIPNFARNPLQDAVQREKDAGFNSSQIRINSDARLANKMNPMGLAVTNRIDEPRGLKDVFAKGHVPNFAKKSAAGGGNPKLQAQIDKLNREYQNALKAMVDAVKRGKMSHDEMTQANQDLKQALKQQIAQVKSRAKRSMPDINPNLPTSPSSTRQRIQEQVEKAAAKYGPALPDVTQRSPIRLPFTQGEKPVSRIPRPIEPHNKVSFSEKVFKGINKATAGVVYGDGTGIRGSAADPKKARDNKYTAPFDYGKTVPFNMPSFPQQKTKELNDKIKDLAKAYARGKISLDTFNQKTWDATIGMKQLGHHAKLEAADLRTLRKKGQDYAIALKGATDARRKESRREKIGGAFKKATGKARTTAGKIGKASGNLGFIFGIQYLLTPALGKLDTMTNSSAKNVLGLTDQLNNLQTQMDKSEEGSAAYVAAQEQRAKVEKKLAEEQIAATKHSGAIQAVGSVVGGATIIAPQLLGSETFRAGVKNAGKGFIKNTKRAGGALIKGLKYKGVGILAGRAAATGAAATGAAGAGATAGAVVAGTAALPITVLAAAAFLIYRKVKKDAKEANDFSDSNIEEAGKADVFAGRRRLASIFDKAAKSATDRGDYHEGLAAELNKVDKEDFAKRPKGSPAERTADEEENLKKIQAKAEKKYYKQYYKQQAKSSEDLFDQIGANQIGGAPKEIEEKKAAIRKTEKEISAAVEDNDSATQQTAGKKLEEQIKDLITALGGPSTAARDAANALKAHEAAVKAFAEALDKGYVFWDKSLSDAIAANERFVKQVNIRRDTVSTLGGGTSASKTIGLQASLTSQGKTLQGLALKELNTFSKNKDFDALVTKAGLAGKGDPALTGLQGDLSDIIRKDGSTEATNELLKRMGIDAADKNGQELAANVVEKLAKTVDSQTKIFTDGQNAASSLTTAHHKAIMQLKEKHIAATAGLPNKLAEIMNQTSLPTLDEITKTFKTFELLNSKDAKKREEGRTLLQEGGILDPTKFSKDTQKLFATKTGITTQAARDQLRNQTARQSFDSTYASRLEEKIGGNSMRDNRLDKLYENVKNAQTSGQAQNSIDALIAQLKGFLNVNRPQEVKDEVRKQIEGLEFTRSEIGSAGKATGDEKVPELDNLQAQFKATAKMLKLFTAKFEDMAPRDDIRKALLASYTGANKATEDYATQMGELAKSIKIIASDEDGKGKGLVSSFNALNERIAELERQIASASDGG